MITNNVVDMTQYKLRRSLSRIHDLRLKEPIDTSNFTQADYVYINSDNWAYLHQVDYEHKIDTLVTEGLIKSGKVIMDENGVPTVYVTLHNTSSYAVDYTLDYTVEQPEANNNGNTASIKNK